MLRRSQERYQKDLRDLLLVADPALLKSYDEAIWQQEKDRKAHQAMLNRKRKEREKLMHDIAVGGVSLVVGGSVAVGMLYLIIKAFGP